MDALESRASGLKARLERADASVLGISNEVMRLKDDVSRLQSLLRLRLDFEEVRPQVRSPRARRDDVVVGFATSMEKILPRAGVPSLRTGKRAHVALAQNETESLQVVVMPLGRDLRRVSVRVSDLEARGGKRLDADNVNAVPVGYVETKAVPPYGSSHVGWWPDPILDFMDEVNVEKGDAQAFWVRVRAPKGQAPGQYRGKLDVLVGGAPVLCFDLVVRVYGFELPDRSPLPLAITFAPHDHPQPETKARQAEWRKSPDYPINAWKKHRSEWADFLADYYITMDSLYEYKGWEPAFEDLKRLDEQGRLGVFNLGYFSTLEEDQKAADAWRANVLERLRRRYERAKELGILDHAYIYGCDEHPADRFPAVERAAAALKAEFPEVPVMTTTYDHSFGLESVIKSVDAFCPLTPRFDAEKAAKARARGKQVWWYICCGPHHPHANMFIEYPAIEGRLLMGAMTAKYRPDGFLYYQISIWNSRRPIEDGPFTDWDPRSWTTYHGEGSWTSVGP
ncbi:MAG: glycoside hydrolase domain-containing protein, partial [Armatimonadota bacterium]